MLSFFYHFRLGAQLVISPNEEKKIYSQKCKYKSLTNKTKQNTKKNIKQSTKQHNPKLNITPHVANARMKLTSR
jgi:hypothetical protein